MFFRVVKITRGGLVWDQFIINWPSSVSSCNKSLLQKQIICLNLVRIWFIFSTRTFVLNAVKELGNFVGGCALMKAFGTGGQWVNASQISFNIIIFSPTHTPYKIVESRVLKYFYRET